MNKSKLMKYCKNNNFEVMKSIDGDMLIFVLPEQQEKLKRYLKRAKASFRNGYTANLDYVRFKIKVGD